MEPCSAQLSYLLQNEPTRFEERHIEALLIHSNLIEASDVTIQTDAKIMAEIRGRLYPLTRRELSNAEVSDLLNAIYGPNGTTQLMRGEDIDTHYEIRPNRRSRYRHRVNGTGCYVNGHEGIQITIRTIPGTPPLLQDLNIPQDIIDAMQPKEGIIYVTGATGSGKSTLLASMIREIVEQPDANRKILTYEAPIEFVYDDLHMPSSIVSQSEVPRHIPNFATGVRNALRRKPGLILVGESRDSETIAASLEAALTGHPVYTTLHSNGVAQTIRRLVGSFPQNERLGRTIDILETMRLIIWQQLVPSQDGKRTALQEYLVFNESIRDQLLASDPDKITEATRNILNKHGKTMTMAAKEKFDQGIISKRTYELIASGNHS